MGGFFREGEILRATFSDAEKSVLDQLARELIDLLGEGDEHDDPLAAIVGISTNDRIPDDPALARLLPDAYEQPEHSGEFRRYTEHHLREGKRARLEELRHGLNESLELDEAGAMKCAMALNDIRLFLGTRLEVTADFEEQVAAMNEDDPRKAGYAVFSWLGWLQQNLLDLL